MKYKIFLILFILGQIAHAQNNIKVIPEMWTTTVNWDEKYTFLSTESIHLGQIEDYKFNLVFGKDKANAKYYLLTELESAPDNWFFKGKLNLITGYGNRITCIDRNLNSNTTQNGLAKIKSLYFLTPTEYQTLVSQGLKSVLGSVNQYGNIKSYSINNFYLAFDLREKDQREKEELRLKDSIAQVEFEKLSPEDQAKKQREIERAVYAAKVDAQKKADEASGRKRNPFEGAGFPGSRGGSGDPGPGRNNVKDNSEMEGLEERAIISKPTPIKNTTQSTGTVVINFCVDEKGNVFSATQNQLQSTTTDSELVRISTDYVNQYRFVSSSLERQCGSITLTFRRK